MKAKKLICNFCGKNLKDYEISYWKTKIVCHDCYLKLNYNQRLKSNADKLKQLRQNG